MPLKHALAYVFNINIHLLYKVEELTRHEKLLKGREKVRWTVTKRVYGQVSSYWWTLRFHYEAFMIKART